MNAVEENLVTMATKLAEFPPLTAVDRCDSCGAQAYVRWVLAASDLLMCNHHSNRLEASLLKQGFSIHNDDRHLLTNPLTAAY